AREPLYLTTPLFYVNAEPHLGHTYVTLVADVLARFWRARRRTAFVLTGTDVHGDKIAQAAAAAGVSPREHADRVSGIFRATWDAAGLRYDHFIRTTDAYHVAFVQKVLADIHTKGDVYFGSYRGLYCFGCERFYQERELVDGLCPDHRVAPTELAEENYFFRMSAYQERLVAILEANPGLIVPEGYRREVLALLREPVGDLCISRPKSRLSWGREMAFGQDAEFSEEALVARSNGDLANGLGNLASRVLAMQQRYFGGVVQPLAPEAADHAMRAAFAAAARELDVHIADLAFHRGLEAVWRALDHANKYVVETAPFTLAKDPGRLPRVGAILHELCEALRTAAQLLAPFLPETGERLATLLGLPAARLGELDLPWGAAFAPGHRTLPPEPLFPRVEVPAE